MAFLMIHSCYSQEFFRSNNIVKEDITYQSLAQNGTGRKIFSLIGLENNIDVRKIELRTKSRILIKISRDAENRLTAKFSMTPVNLDGNTTIQSFDMDSLLWPDEFKAELSLYNGRHKRGSVSISGTTNGTIKVIDVSNLLSSSIGQISATISDIRFTYETTKLLKLQSLTKSIDYYYSYALLLKDLIRDHDTRSARNNQSAATIFADKIEINRITNLIDEHNFSKVLNLEHNDPVDFLESVERLKRLLQRASTLFKQQLLNNETSDAGTFAFCKQYCNISYNYLIKAMLLQPSDASGYYEVARIDIIKGAKEDITSVSSYYDQNTIFNSTEIYQCIFDEFVVKATDLMNDKNYADALLLLNNAHIIHNWFNTTNSPKYRVSVIAALDGVASSYLRVGNGALGIYNFELANTYFDKADNIFEMNQSMISNVQLPDTAFGEYLRMQYEIAVQYNSVRKYSDAITRLAAGLKICTEINNSSVCRLIDSVLCESHSGNLTKKLDRVEEKIENGQYPDARLQLFKIAEYFSERKCSLSNENIRFEEMSYILFLVFLNEGEILIEAQQPSIAMEKLLYAKSLQQFMKDDPIEIDRLIEIAAEPEIIELISQAKYHTWANRIDKAKEFRSKAIILDEKYFPEGNNRIILALGELNDQMKSRKCLSNEIKYSDIVTRMKIAIKNEQFSKLGALIDESVLFRNSYPECEIEDNEVQEIISNYSSVLSYYKQYSNIIDKLFSEGYNEAIPMYLNLLVFYNYHDLFHHNIYFPNLESFIINQKLPRLTMATAEYYMQNNDPVTSFKYVKIFKDQHGSAKSIKHLTTEIAKSFAIRDDKLKVPVNEMIEEYTSGDKWFSHFKVAYLKYRLFN